QLRRLLLYPAELREHIKKQFTILGYRTRDSQTSLKIEMVKDLSIPAAGGTQVKPASGTPLA
ncbi:MAG TPA: hypothetical protein VHL50_10430, partial [Pyrinomonadaceae bacterium]|nr:hypothetical protein [Pyrinomonadaceae bacterium]